MQLPCIFSEEEDQIHGMLEEIDLHAYEDESHLKFQVLAQNCSLKV